MKVEVDALGSPSLIVRTVSVDVKQLSKVCFVPNISAQHLVTLFPI